jgi:hypothetical protein
MGASDAAGGYAQRLLDSEYVQQNLAEAGERLRDAYRRASKRRVRAARDERVRARVRQAAQSLAEAADALKTGRRKPKGRRGRRLIVVLGVAAGATAAVLAANEGLRKRIFDGESSEERDPRKARPSDVEVVAA